MNKQLFFWLHNNRDRIEECLHAEFTLEEMFEFSYHGLLLDGLSKNYESLNITSSLILTKILILIEDILINRENGYFSWYEKEPESLSTIVKSCYALEVVLAVKKSSTGEQYEPHIKNARGLEYIVDGFPFEIESLTAYLTTPRFMMDNYIADEDEQRIITFCDLLPNIVKEHKEELIEVKVRDINARNCLN
ncbi:hypothetical protein M0R04_01180 [Candidatus Dojkabacteria bacterium]|jgi:hypothetical protein|nr:hypothetical protein [Candidatus Dojkabacteria bacterium]